MAEHKIYTTAVSDVYPAYVAKLERKNRTKEELDEVITWLTGYDLPMLEAVLKNGTDFKTFFIRAPRLNENRKLIQGVICGIRVEDMEPGVMQEIRYLDKMVDELAKGKAMEKVLRTAHSL